MRIAKKPALLENFIRRWNDTISKIEINAMPQSELNKIRSEFSKDAHTMTFSQSLMKHSFKGNADKWSERLELSSDDIDDVRVRLTAACAISNSKWKEAHPGLLDRIKIGVRELNIFKKG